MLLRNIDVSSTHTLTPKEHEDIHLLRYECYGSEYDRTSVILREQTNLTTEQVRLERIKMSHVTNQKNKTGFYSSDVQRENGKKGGKVQTPLKVEKHKKKQKPEVANALAKGTVWKHPLLNEPLVVPGGKVELVCDFKQVFLDALPEGDDKEKLKKVNKYDFTSTLGKVFHNERRGLYNFKFLGIVTV